MPLFDETSAVQIVCLKKIKEVNVLASKEGIALTLDSRLSLDFSSKIRSNTGMFDSFSFKFTVMKKRKARLTEDFLLNPIKFGLRYRGINWRKAHSKSRMNRVENQHFKNTAKVKIH